MMKRLYFDYNASAPLVAGLADQLSAWLALDDKNPNSVHADGRAAHARLEAARREVLQALGAGKKDRLIFTSGGTESNNTVLRSTFSSAGTKKTLVLTGIEHSSTLNCAKFLEKQGAKLVWLPVSAGGQIDAGAFAAALTDDVFLVSVMLANNETGFVLPVADLAAQAHAKKIPFHADAVCAIGKQTVNFTELGVDYLTFSAHKFGALKGVGGIILGNAALDPLIIGGPQESEKRAGTQNLHGILSAAFALRASLNGLDAEIARLQTLRKRLKAGIAQAYPAAVFNESAGNLAQTLNVSFPGLSGTVLLTNLDLEGVSASHGSACASGSLEISHVLRFIGLPVPLSSSAIRFSFGRSTTEADIDDLEKRLVCVLERMTKK
jgi:cysteine desulfurase